MIFLVFVEVGIYSNEAGKLVSFSDFSMQIRHCLILKNLHVVVLNPVYTSCSDNSVKTLKIAFTKMRSEEKKLGNTGLEE